MIVLAELQPLDRTTNTRKMLRATTANDSRVTALNDVAWRPAISGAPSTAIRLFKGDFDGEASPAGGNIDIQIDQFLSIEPNARGFAWQGAPVKFYAGELGQPWPWEQVFDGLVEQGSAEKNKVSLTCKVNTAPFDADILTLKYAGTGGAEGPEDLKDSLKPWVLGRCFNVEPKLINAVDNVYQFSAYGPIQAVSVLYERGSEFAAPLADYTTYTTLLAATIAPGQWATCLTEGMIRLGAPAFGVITGDIDGDKFDGTWRNTTGAIILRVASNAAVNMALIETASFTALDTAMLSLPYDGMIGIVLSEQETVLQFASRLAAPCNGQVGVSLLGKMFVGQIAIGVPVLTLDAQQRQLPAVTSSSETTTSPPFSYIEFGYARSWRVHNDDEIVDYKALLGDAVAGVTFFQDTPPTIEESTVGQKWFNTITGKICVRVDTGGILIDGGILEIEGELPYIPWVMSQTQIIGDSIDRVNTMEVGADVTSNHQVIIAPVPTQNIYKNYDGSVKTNEFPRTITIGITKGGVDVRKDNGTVYGVITGSLAAYATVNRTVGSADKGKVTFTAGPTANGSVSIPISVDGVASPSLVITFIAKPDTVPGPAGGAPGAYPKSRQDSSFPNIVSTTFAQITSTNAGETPMLITVAAAQTVYCTLPAEYSHNGTAQRALIAKWQYRTAGSGGAFTDVGAQITGTSAFQSPSFINAEGYEEPGYSESGYIQVNQNFTPAAGDYEIICVAKLSAATANPVTIYSGTANINVA